MSSQAFVFDSLIACREWLDILTEDIFSEDLRLFENVNLGDVRQSHGLRISPRYLDRPGHSDYLWFVGRLYGFAVFHGLLVDERLVHVIYPMLALDPRSSWSKDLIGLAFAEDSGIARLVS